MQPLKPTEVHAILENRPNPQPGEVEEYERLLSQRFTVDPDFAPSQAPAEEVVPAPAEEREARIAELHQRLFGPVDESSSSAPAYATFHR